MVFEPHNCDSDACANWCVQIQAEARIRLVSGIKRYFHGKRGEGLLSARGMQLLDFICDVQMDHAERPLFMWAYAERWDSLLSCGTTFSALTSENRPCIL